VHPIADKPAECPNSSLASTHRPPHCIGDPASAHNRKGDPVGDLSQEARRVWFFAESRRLVTLERQALGGTCEFRRNGDDESIERGSGHGSSEVEALAEVAAKTIQRLMLVGRLHAFGYNGHPYTVGELDDSRDQRFAGCIASEAGNEAPVDLDDVYEVMQEVTEGRVAGAEVVERRSHSHTL
jgi:hypothetical protein